MNRAEIRDVVLAVLHALAPEVDPATIRADADLRAELDLDSMDFLRFVVQLDERLGVAVPESDYASVRTVNGCVAYVAARRADEPAAPDADRAPRAEGDAAIGGGARTGGAASIRS